MYSSSINSGQESGVTTTAVRSSILEVLLIILIRVYYAILIIDQTNIIISKFSKDYFSATYSK